ncbi:O-antigen translocase [Fibrobacter sp. UWB11]|uniref:O-antigen translocase n=1 Tax=Fibrobacter sp. UWB11 TaxID=1896202 RepID=UPI000928F707|nr:O-antigen translocase [Fibrobacter sp. UWB11]SIO08935.1 polysaccharide transporter, PST family [Fibrobacter sp. UWB11]
MSSKDKTSQESANFMKLFLGSGMVTFLNAVRVFVVNKLLAVFLPPSAFACVGQFMNFMTMGQATSSLALQNGWVSLTAQNKSNFEQLRGVWRGGFRLTTFASIVTFAVALVLCFIVPLEKFFPDIHPRLVQAAVIFALPGVFATNIITITSSVMNGLGHYRRWALINMVTSLWQMLWVAFFLYTGRLSVLSIVATQSVIAGIFATQIASRAGFSLREIRKSALDIRSPWMSYALMGIVPMVLTPVVLTFMRLTIGENLGWNAAGIWQGIWKISDFLTTFFSAILGVIILPKVSAKLTQSEFWGMFRPVLVKTLALALVAVAILYLGRSLLVTVMLSSAYAGAADYMPMQLLGDFFRVGGWALGLVLVARRETKKFLILEICSEVVLASATYGFVKLYEFNGPMMAYALENFLTLVASFIIVSRLDWAKK